MISNCLKFKEEFNYGDIVALQNRLTDFGVEDVDLTAKLSKNIDIKIPIISSPMDTVTKADMAIAMALQGGIGVIHYNMSPEKQAEEAEKVKRFNSGFIENPIVASPETLIREIAKIRNEKGISTIPITEDGKPHGKLKGIITKNDYSMHLHSNMPVRERMTPLEGLLVVKWSEISKDKNPLNIANKILLESKRGNLPVVNDRGNLRYLVTKTDIEKNESYPYATKDSKKRLKVAVAIESRLELAMDRADATHKFADAFVIDTSHAYGTFISKMIKELHTRYPRIDVIAGNVSVPDAVQYLIENGADAVKIGTGPGSICTTTKNLGVGRNQGSAVYHCAKRRDELANKYGHIPIIADGGIKEYGDFLKALALGADSTMVGSMVAGTKEAPGEMKQIDGRYFKEYRGMGSKEALNAGGDKRYGTDKMRIRMPEGIVTKIEYKGLISEIVPMYVAALKQGMQKTGCRNIEELHKYALLTCR
ncbi:MAG: IMP dehydrogenase [Candidatus Paceibacterota bacterium]